MSQISKRIRDQVRTFLNASDGFNATYATVAAAYGVTAFTIDFTGAGYNFFQGQVDPKQLESTTNIKYPLMCLFAMTAKDDNRQKFQEFSGVVTVGLDVHYSFTPGHALFDFESIGDALEDTVVQIMNRESNQVWDIETVYNGEVSLTRYPLQLGAQNWRQTFRFLMTFEVHDQK